MTQVVKDAIPDSTYWKVICIINPDGKYAVQFATCQGKGGK